LIWLARINADGPPALSEIKVVVGEFHPFSH
jgi:hypothetical protein